MAVDAHGLCPRDEVLAGVEVCPAALEDAEGLVRDEVGDGAAQEVRRRHEVGVEDGDQVVPGQGQPVGQCPGFVIGSLRSPDVGDA